MLSKIDIEKELGNGINIVPFREKNIKENSINLTASKFSWSMSDFKFSEKYVDDNNQQINIEKGKTSVFKIDGHDTIVIPPYSTVLIETEEVMGLDGRIGGSYHSKVGIVSQGIGHIGTMLGPGFCGHSLIAIHNVSKEKFELRVGETFVSIVFNYLKTPVEAKNNTVGGHVDKMSELGITMTREDRSFIAEDWKSDINKIKEELNKDNEFQGFKINFKNRKISTIKKFFTNNFKSILIIFIVAILILLCCIYIDNKFTNTNFVQEYWIILRIVIIVPIITTTINNMIKK